MSRSVAKAALAGALVASYCAGQPSDPVNTLSRPVAAYDVQGADLDEALRNLFDATGRTIVVGLERAPAAASSSLAQPKISIHIVNGTVGEILKQICFGDPRYTFSDAGEGVINVRPVVDASEPAAILGLTLVQADIKIREWPRNFFGRVPEVVEELKTYLSGRARDYRARTSRLPRGSPGIIMTTNVSPPEIESRLKDLTVRGLLNGIAAYTLTHVITDASGNRLSEPTGWEFRFNLDRNADTGLGGYPQWKPFPFP